MANKDTGEFLTKSPDGVVMSLDAMNRRRTAIANATEHALMQNMYGKWVVILNGVHRTLLENGIKKYIESNITILISKQLKGIN